MKTVLVTGGAGFIGSHLADELLKNNYKVVIIDDLSGGSKDNIPKHIKFVKGSITNTKLVKKLFSKYKFDYVFHLAAYAAEGLSHHIRKFNYENNLMGSINLINESIRYNIKCFVFTSSMAVYGTNQVPLKENLTPMPEDPYGIAKAAVEKDLKAANEMFGLNYIIFRPHSVYGERQNINDRYRNVIGIFMNQIMQGKSLTVYGDGNQTRAFSYIGDIVPIIANSIKFKNAYNQIFNVGADGPCTINQLAENVKKAMNSKVKIKHLKQRFEVTHAYPSHEKANKIFGRKKSIPFEKGLKRMADWVKKNGIKKQSIFKNIEITKNLHPNWRVK